MVDKKFKDELSWEEKAKKNPLYAVMSADERFAEKGSDPADWTEEDLEIFFKKGKMLFDSFILPVLLRANINIESAFIVEYGSGLGTILKAIKAAGYDCAGIDISPTMLEFSRKVVPEVTDLSCLDEHGRSNIPSGSADLVYSRAVMQHIKELSHVRTAIAEMSRILKPGGFLKLHFRTQSSLPFDGTPSYLKWWVLNFETRSFIIGPSKRKWLPVTLPTLMLTRHTNWVGAPLSLRNLRLFLEENRLSFIGLEQDFGGKDNFVWALARKKPA
jgi:SAM-dependent methyltransferase